MPAAGKQIEQFLNNSDKDNITVGKYLISPLPKQLDNGWWAASVSIRSGAGSGTHDRVLRLTRLFQGKLAAAEYAIDHHRPRLSHDHSTPPRPTRGPAPHPSTANHPALA